MSRYQSRRHRYLMDESEQALSDAALCGNSRAGRIASEVLGDAKTLRLWESRHADLVLPVAEQNRRAPQIFALRDIEVRLIHRRALIRYIRQHGVIGKRRDRLFSAFYGHMDAINAVLAEHRQYTLAVSSRLSADHLITVMSDPVSVTLLREYESIYDEYFELYCFMVMCRDDSMVDAIKVEMVDRKRKAMHAIKRIHSVRPQRCESSFDRQMMLARSGRYPIRDYMVG